MTKHPPPVLCQKTRENLRSKETKNSALFFVMGWEETEVIKRENALFFVKGGEETEVNKKKKNSAVFFVKGWEETKVNKKRKQCTILCQGMRGEKIVHCSLSRDKRRLRSIKRENNALFFVFFVKRRKEIEVNKNRKQCTVLCQGTCTVLC